MLVDKWTGQLQRVPALISCQTCPEHGSRPASEGASKLVPIMVGFSVPHPQIQIRPSTATTRESA